MINAVIKRPVMISMILIGLCLLGVVSYKQLPVELFPYTELPMLIVNVNTPTQNDPAYVEHNGVIPLEGAIAALEDIERIESFINQRNATIFVYYTENSNQKYAYLRLEECVAASKDLMGEDFSATVSKVNTNQLSNQFMAVQARGQGSLDQIRGVVDEKVVPELESIDGIATVQVYGGRQHSIEVIIDENQLETYDITMSQVRTRIVQGAAEKMFLGQAREGRTKFFVNLDTQYTSLSELEQVVVKDEGPLFLKQIATFVDGGAEPESISRINSMEAVSISLIRNREANLLSLSNQTRRIIDQLNQAVKSDSIELVIQADEAQIIDENMDAIFLLAIIGSFLAIAVLWIFLKNITNVLVVAVTIPISVLISLNLFYALDITINTLTLVGIAIAIGMLLDNSIVVLENIHRHLANGEPVRQAVVSGTAEVWKAITAATLTTICVFIPFIFSQDYLVKTLGRQIGVAIISTLLVSLSVAFLLIPTFTYQVLSRRKNQTRETFNPISMKLRSLQIYNVLLKACLRFPARTVIIGIVLLFFSIILCLGVSINVPEEVELDQFNLYAIMPSGTTLKAADEEVLEMDKRLVEFEEIEERFANIQEDAIILTFMLKEDYEKIARNSLEDVKEMIYRDLRRAFPRVDFSYDEPSQNVNFQGGGGGGGGSANFSRMLGIGASQEQVLIRGQDFESMIAVADDIQYNIDELETISNSRLNVSSQQPSIDLFLDKTALSHFEVILSSMTAEMNAFQREMSTGVSVMQEPDDLPIVLKTLDEDEKNSEDLRRLQIPSSAGGTIPILQLAQLVYSSGYSSIRRVNQEKQIILSYSFAQDVQDSKRFLQQARNSIEDIVANMSPPPGVIIEVQHDEADLSDFYFLIFVGIMLIFMVLASTFESLTTPLAMMFTLPLATIGAFWGLILTNNSIYNANALIGFLILLGVVVNNGIILIDYSKLLRKRNYRPTRALLTAGQARVRPILITTLTTVLAMLPVAMGQSEYISQIGAPFAITVIGGLSLATLFTLLLVPTVAFGLENAFAWWRRLSWKVKVIQFLAYAGGGYLIYWNVSAILWQIVYVTVLAMAVPAITYFIITSLRRSSTTLIPVNQPITITIRNVVKLYDDYSRFRREWRQGKRMRDRLHREGKLLRSGILSSLMWQIPLLAFLAYFCYFYLESGFWQFIFAVLISLDVIYLLKTFFLPEGRAFAPLKDGKKSRLLLFKLVYWGLPLANLVWFYKVWLNRSPVFIFGLIWFFSLAVYQTSQKLYRDRVNIARISGRLKRIRKSFYRMVLLIPIIGKQKSPFRALNQVSLEIGSGMFGLVGPNGAGKTTLMRIICGILNQSRGKVWFNEFDIDEKREELQSLIGYLPQEFGTYENMSAAQYLDYQAMLKGIWDADKRKEAVERVLRGVHLYKKRDHKIRTFSGGMKQRVGIAQTLLHLPRILVVDEPTAGLDPRERIKFRNLLTELARERIVIFSTHIIEDISSSCNRLAVLFNGKVKFVGSPMEMSDLARGYIWQARISQEEFNRIHGKAKIIHHLRDDDKIRVRIMADEKPLPEAEEVSPTLEDSYMYLLGKVKMENANGGEDE